MNRLAGITAVVAPLAVVGGLLLSLGGGGRAQAQTVEPVEPGALFVTGSATVTATPDEATIDITVSALELGAVQAITTASNAMNDVIDAVIVEGVAVKDIRTTNVSLRPEYEFALSRRILVGFRFSNSIRVTVRDTDSVGPVIDRAVSAGGDLVSLGNIAFQVSNRSALEDRARLSAIDDAIAKAEAMAARAGVVLGRAISIREVGFATPFAVPFEAAPDVGFATPIFTGTDDIIVRVEMQFEIL